MRQQKYSGFFKRVESQSTGHGRKPVKEFVPRIAAFKIVEQSLNRHAGTKKNGYAVHDVRVLEDRARHIFTARTLPGKS